MKRAELDDKDCHPQHWNKLAAAFNDYDGNPYRNATILYHRDGEELMCYPGMSVAYDICRSFDPCDRTRPERLGDWIKKVLREFKGEWSKVYERYRYQSGDQDAEDPYAEFCKFYGGNSILMYAFVVFDQNDAIVDLLGKVCSEDSQSDTGILGEQREKSNISTIGKKRSKASGGIDGKSEKSEEKQFVLKIRDESKADTDSFSKLRDAEKDEAELSSMILKTPNVPEDMQKTALDALAAIQLLKKNRRLGLVEENFKSPDTN